MNTIAAVCLILCEGQADPVPADAVISARDGGAVSPVHTSGALWLSARKSVYGSSPKSVQWEVEPEFLDTGNRSERGLWKEDDGFLNPVIVIGYADCPESALVYDAKTNSRGIIVRLYVAKGDTQDRDKVFIAVKTNIPPPDPSPQPNPGPQPGPKPTPVVKSLFLAVVEDSLNRSPTTAGILNSGYWRSLPDGMSRVIPENTADRFEDPYVAETKKILNVSNLPVGMAYLLIYDRDNPVKPLWYGPLPAAAEIEKLVNTYTGKR